MVLVATRVRIPHPAPFTLKTVFGFVSVFSVCPKINGLMFRTRRKANRYRNLGLLLLLASCLLFFFSYETRNFVLFFVGCGVLVGAFPLFQKFKIWRSGAKGEEKVAKCLKHLGAGITFSMM